MSVIQEELQENVRDVLPNTGANLACANLTDAISGGIKGTPYALPTGSKLVSGVLQPA